MADPYNKVVIDSCPECGSVVARDARDVHAEFHANVSDKLFQLFRDMARVKYELAILKGERGEPWLTT